VPKTKAVSWLKDGLQPEGSSFQAKGRPYRQYKKLQLFTDEND
jgi:hypothetical protein